MDERVKTEFYLGAQVEAIYQVEKTAMRMWLELIDIRTKTPWWRPIAKWRRRWMERTAKAFWLASRDQIKETKKVFLEVKK